MTLDRVPCFGRHVENLGDVILYPVLVVARTGKVSRLFLWPKQKDPQRIIKHFFVRIFAK